MLRAAWTLFQEIEAAGGAAKAIESGLIQKKVAATRAEHERAIARRKEPLTGTSDFPHLAEDTISVLAVPRTEAKSPPAAVSFLALAPMRFAKPFEELREASDRMLAKAGARPKIFLANLGKPSDFTTRAMFAKNFFETGGIAAVEIDGFGDSDAMIAAYRKSGAKLACLCSSDAVYEQRAAEAARALAAAGATHIYLAGRPKTPEPLQQADVNTFVYSGCDALAILKAAHDILGSKLGQALTT